MVFIMLRVISSRSRSKALPRLLKAALASPGRRLPSTWSSRVLNPHRRHFSAETGPLVKPPNASQSPPLMSETELVGRLMKSQRVWWWIGSIVLGGVGLVAFGPELKLGMSKHTAEVASRSLQDETLRDNTRELASQIVQTVLNDPKVLDQASRFMQRLVVMDSTREALRALVIHTLNDPLTREQVADLTKRTVAALVEDPKTLRQVVDLLRSMVLDPRAKEALLQLLEEIMRDEKTRANLTQLLAHTFLQDAVKQNVGRTLSDSVHDVLSRNDIQNHAKEFVSGVVRDQTVQAQGGDAIWGTVMYAVTPSWLSWIWEHPEGLENSGPMTPAKEAAKAVVAAAAAENKLEKEKMNESSDKKDDAQASASKSSVTVKKAHSRSKSVRTEDVYNDQALIASRNSSTRKASMKKTRSKRVPPIQETESKTTDAATNIAPSHANIADVYRDPHWNGSNSGFV